MWARTRQHFTTEYGNICAASIGAIQRGLLQIDEQGGDKFFGEPMLNIDDFMQTDARPGRDQHPGRRQADECAAPVRDLPAVDAVASCSSPCPKWATSTKPKLVFFFDEAHLLFNEAPKPLLVERIELVVRLVRSKGVGVYFVTQNPLDIPDTVLGQLGNRVQHALRAFTPRDQKAVKAAATHDARQPQARYRNRDHGAGGGRGAGKLSGRKGQPVGHRAGLRATAGQPDRADHARAAQGADRRARWWPVSTKKWSTANRPTSCSRAARRTAAAARRRDGAHAGHGPGAGGRLRRHDGRA